MSQRLEVQLVLRRHRSHTFHWKSPIQLTATSHTNHCQGGLPIQITTRVAYKSLPVVGEGGRRGPLLQRGGGGAFPIQITATLPYKSLPTPQLSGPIQTTVGSHTNHCWVPYKPLRSTNAPRRGRGSPLEDEGEHRSGASAWREERPRASRCVHPNKDDGAGGSSEGGRAAACAALSPVAH